ncbi:hypothetical protein PLESTF_001620400 [Pleodorina starrii]|nr:hypothetical protein PLESTF_001620400 [Pleodorina starrii]
MPPLEELPWLMAATPNAAADLASRVWIPLLVERFAAFLPPNEVACNLRLVDKATARQLKSPEHTTVRLSQPAPHHAFVRRWAEARALKPLTWRQRRRLLQLTARSGSLANLEALLALAEHCPLRPDVLEAAAGGGQLAMCQALRQSGCPWSDETLREAARGGHWAVCEWLLASGCPWSGAAPGAAASGGHVGLADWLLAAAPTGGVNAACLLRGAATACDLATLQRLYDTWSGGLLEGTDVDDVVMPAAVLSPTPDWQAKAEWLAGRVSRPERVILLVGVSEELYGRYDWRERAAWMWRRWGYRTDPELVFVFAHGAVRSGNTDAARCLLAQGLPPADPLSPRITAIAAEAGHLGMLQLLGSLGHAMDFDTLKRALRTGNLAVVRWVAERLGQQGPGQWLLSADLFCAGASSGSREVLEWLRERGCPWGADTFAAAAAAGSEEQLEWLAERGCPLGGDGAPYVQPAARSDLSVLRCLRRLGCPWSDTTFARCSHAVREDPVERHCPRPAGLSWLLGQGCRVNWREVGNALSREAVAWLRHIQEEEGN